MRDLAGTPLSAIYTRTLNSITTFDEKLKARDRVIRLERDGCRVRVSGDSIGGYRSSHGWGPFQPWKVGNIHKRNEVA